MEEMTQSELINSAIDSYVMLQRIKKAQSQECENKELEYLITVYEIKLASFGIVVESLKM